MYIFAGKTVTEEICTPAEQDALSDSERDPAAILYLLGTGRFETAEHLLAPVMPVLDRMVHEDTENKYYSPESLFEEYLIKLYYSSEKNLCRIGIRVSFYYRMYAEALRHQDRPAEAEEYYIKAILWDPVCFEAFEAYAEIFRTSGNLSRFELLTDRSFAFAGDACTFSRALQHKAWCLAERNCTEAAAACRYLSVLWNPPRIGLQEPQFSQVQTENIRQLAEKYGFPVRPYILDIKDSDNLFCSPVVL